MKFEVLTTVTVTITVLRVVIPCTVVEGYWLFREARCLVWLEVWQQVRVRRRYAVPHCRLSHPKCSLSGFTSETPPRGVCNKIVYCFLRPVPSWAASDYWL